MFVYKEKAQTNKMSHNEWYM